VLLKTTVTVELHLSKSWLSGSPIIWIGSALWVNILVLQLYYIFLWLKFFPRLSNTYKEFVLMFCL